MRFSVVAVSLFAGASMAATSTDYITEEVTITSCAATVTNCPARSTQVSLTSYPAPVTTGSVVGTVIPPGSVPSGSGPVASAPVASAPVASGPVASAPAISSPSGWAPPAVNASQPATTFSPVYATTSAQGVASTPAGSVSVIAITTCVPTVIYSTVSYPGAESTPAAPKPSSAGSIPLVSNGTTPSGSATATPIAFTGAAAQVQVGGAAIAAIFGLAAFLL